MTKTSATCRRTRPACAKATRLASSHPSRAAAASNWHRANENSRRSSMATKPDVAGAPAQSHGRPAVALSKEEILRYSRHLIMPEVGMDGQLKLKQAKVLCIGTGGLGAPLGLYLAAAGVGRLGLIDFDRVDFTNLQRQVLFSTSDVGRPKIEAAADRLSKMNPDIEIVTH